MANELNIPDAPNIDDTVVEDAAIKADAPALSTLPSYRVHIARESTIVEVRFEPLDGAPRLETVYVSPADPIPYKDNQVVEISPTTHAKLALRRTADIEQERARQQAASMPEVSAISELEAKEAEAGAVDGTNEAEIPNEEETPPAVEPTAIAPTGNRRVRTVKSESSSDAPAPSPPAEQEG